MNDPLYIHQNKIISIKKQSFQQQESSIFYKDEIKKRSEKNLFEKKFLIVSKTRLFNHQPMDRRYTCKECGLELKSSNLLMSHKLKHKPGITCKICKKIFYKTSIYHQHILIHAGIRPYKCDVCNKTFPQRTNLITHRKKHPGPLPTFIPRTSIAELARNVLEKL